MIARTIRRWDNRLWWRLRGWKTVYAFQSRKDATFRYYGVDWTKPSSDKTVVVAFSVEGEVLEVCIGNNGMTQAALDPPVAVKQGEEVRIMLKEFRKKQ